MQKFVNVFVGVVNQFHRYLGSQSRMHITMARGTTIHTT
jgi:hypothetical protein